MTVPTFSSINGFTLLLPTCSFDSSPIPVASCRHREAHCFDSADSVGADSSHSDANYVEFADLTRPWLDRLEGHYLRKKADARLAP